MKILLVRPKPPKETIGLQHVMICEPLELEYLVGNLDKNKGEVHIIDMILEKRPFRYFLEFHRPDIVGITGYITHVAVIKAMAKEIKSFSSKIITIVGGVHAEVVPEDFMDPHLDYIIHADPIGTFLRIVDHTAEEGERGVSIPGTYQPGNTRKNILDFKYSPPDRAAVAGYRSRYYYMFHNPCALIKTSFGCPYDCSFCFCREVTGGKYFARPVEEVISELKTIPEKEIYIVDDDFLYDVGRLERFCDALEREKIRKNYLVYGRADFIANNEKTMKRLADNGLKAVIVGIESVREKDLVDFNKRTTGKINEKAVEILKNLDIELYATMILHLDYSKEDFLELERNIKKMGITFVNLQPLTPLPGTEIFHQYEDRLIVDRKDYAKWDLAHIVLQPEHMSICAYYYQIIRLYYRIVMRPSAIRKMIGKYGLWQVIKMWWGSSFVSIQYITKMIKGR